jgi:hypothetical protein
MLSIHAFGTRRPIKSGRFEIFMITSSGMPGTGSTELSEFRQTPNSMPGNRRVPAFAFGPAALLQ